MKIQLDTIQKTIKLESSVKLQELFDTLNKLLPGGQWAEFTLETNTIINWSNPIVINPVTPWWERPYISPYWSVTCGTTPANTTQESIYNAGTYNIEI